MNILKEIKIRDGRITTYWDRTTTADDREIPVGKFEVSRGPTDETVNGITLTQWLEAAPLFAELIRSNVESERAAAKAVQDAARQAHLDWWNSLTPEEQAAEIARNTPPPPVPEFVMKRQLRAWLIINGKMDAVLAFLQGIQDPTQKALAYNDWDNATVYERSHSLVATLGAVLRMTDAQIDTAFIEASSL